MLSSSSTSISLGSRTHPISNIGNHIGSKLNVGQPNIEFVMDDSDGPRRIVPSYSTMDTISGHIAITAPFDLRFEDIDIAFIGTSHTSVDRVTESTHRFLTLSQPINVSDFPLPRIFEAGKTYRFPFTFNVPAQLLPEACTHDVVADHVRNTHLMLPPSLGDPDLSGFGSALLDDLAPEMSKIRYGVRVRILERGVVDNVIRVLGERLKKVRVKPAFEEQAPLNIDGNEEFRLKQEKIIKKGLFKGKLGTLTAQTMQPRPFTIPGARTSDNAPITTVAKLVLRFDPADEGAKPPALSSLHAKLKSSTFYASSPRHDLPSRTSLANDVSQGVYDEDVALNSLCIATANWEEHTETSNPASESHKSGSFYTVQILFPVTLTVKKSFIPTFHSCLISRTYTLSLQFAPRGGPNISLKVPVQICADGSNTGIENVRARSVEADMYREAADVFTPRSIAPTGFDGSRSSVQARDELPPDYAAFSPSIRAA